MYYFSHFLSCEGIALSTFYAFIRLEKSLRAQFTGSDSNKQKIPDLRPTPAWISQSIYKFKEKRKIFKWALFEKKLKTCFVQKVFYQYLKNSSIDFQKNNSYKIALMRPFRRPLKLENRFRNIEMASLFLRKWHFCKIFRKTQK